jgi:hypothetical protein
MNQFNTKFFYTFSLVAIVFGLLFFWNRADKEFSEKSKVVELLLQAARENQAEKSYWEYFSQEFQNATTLDEFKRFFLENEPFFAGNDAQISKGESGELVVKMAQNGEELQLHMDLIKKDGVFEVYRMQPYSSLVAEADAKASVEMKKISVGTKVNDRGVIEKPVEKMSPQTEEIFVNVIVFSTKRGESVKLYLTHIEEGQEALPLSTSLQEKGETTLSFSYTAPLGGWHKGEYQVEARSDGKSIKTRFKIE